VAKPAAIQRDERTQVRRDDRDLGHNHPVRLVAGIDERLDEVEPLGELLRLQFRGRLGDLLTEVAGQLLEIEADKNVADRLGADLAVKLSSPNSSCALRYSSSERS